MEIVFTYCYRPFNRTKHADRFVRTVRTGQKDQICPFAPCERNKKVKFAHSHGANEQKRSNLPVRMVRMDKKVQIHPFAPCEWAKKVKFTRSHGAEG